MAKMKNSIFSISGYAPPKNAKVVRNLIFFKRFSSLKMKQIKLNLGQNVSTKPQKWPWAFPRLELKKSAVMEILSWRIISEPSIFPFPFENLLKKTRFRLILPVFWRAYLKLLKMKFVILGNFRYARQKYSKMRKNQLFGSFARFKSIPELTEGFGLGGEPSPTAFILSSFLKFHLQK